MWPEDCMHTRSMLGVLHAKNSIFSFVERALRIVSYRGHTISTPVSNIAVLLDVEGDTM